MAKQRTWTANQLSAITARGGSVIVSAAAGSGKTTVLVERVIRMITDPDPEKRVDVDRLLIVTYTRAAAAELRTRLFNALAEAIRENPSDAGLVRQQALLSKANISTVDSFCSSLAREFFYELDIDRKYRIGERYGDPCAGCRGADLRPLLPAERFGRLFFRFRRGGHRRRRNTFCRCSL